MGKYDTVLSQAGAASWQWLPGRRSSLCLPGRRGPRLHLGGGCRLVGNMKACSRLLGVDV